MFGSGVGYGPGYGTGGKEHIIDAYTIDSKLTHILIHSPTQAPAGT